MLESNERQGLESEIDRLKFSVSLKIYQIENQGFRVLSMNRRRNPARRDDWFDLKAGS